VLELLEKQGQTMLGAIQEAAKSGDEELMRKLIKNSFGKKVLSSYNGTKEGDEGITCFSRSSA
jgi:hypothetical protein